MLSWYALDGVPTFRVASWWNMVMCVVLWRVTYYRVICCGDGGVGCATLRYFAMVGVTCCGSELL